jgi:hypothetical protein
MRVKGQDLRVGDTIDIWWPPGKATIIELELYEGPLYCLLKGNAAGEPRIAKFAVSKVGMTIPPGTIYEVVSLPNDSRVEKFALPAETQPINNSQFTACTERSRSIHH